MTVRETRTPAEHLLGSRSRVAALAALLVGPCTLAELTRQSRCAKSAAAIALRQLENAGVVTRDGDRFAISASHRGLIEQIVRLGPAPTQEDVFADYLGKWVALSREGKIVGSDDNPEVLAKRNRANGIHGYRYIRVPHPDDPPPMDTIWGADW